MFIQDTILVKPFIVVVMCHADVTVLQYFLVIAAASVFESS